MKSKFVAQMVLILSLLLQFRGDGLPTSYSNPNHHNATIVDGEILADTTWSGEILVTGHVTVMPNVVLTVLPGTKVRFQHYRGYREPEKRLLMQVLGEIHANGNADHPIYFTSDALDPQNGDWSMLRLISTTGVSSFHYVVFEFAQQGLNVWNSSPEISHSIFRWNNWEGVYFESFCAPTILHTHMVENGYNGLAAEQSNSLTLDTIEAWRNGTSGIHIDNSKAVVRRSLIHDNGAHGLSVDDHAELWAEGDAIYSNRVCGIGFGEGNNTVYTGNLDFKSGNGPGGMHDLCGPVNTLPSTFYPPTAVETGFTPDMSYSLGYIPGDEALDGYLYVYPNDETRQILRKIGAGLGLTWALDYFNGSIWTATLQGNFYRLDPATGTVQDHFTVPTSQLYGGLSQPWGMAFDDYGIMWVVDFAERKLFKIDPTTHQIINSFATPDPSAGGCKGLAWDGQYLNTLCSTTSVIYKIDLHGNLVRTITLDSGGNSGIAWDGQYFWIPSGGRIYKYSPSGTRKGWIYSASEGTWDMAWDGTYLWASQRTNENWQDAKIYQIDILEDHHHTIYLPLTIKVFAP